MATLGIFHDPEQTRGVHSLAHSVTAASKRHNTALRRAKMIILESCLLPPCSRLCPMKNSGNSSSTAVLNLCLVRVPAGAYPRLPDKECLSCAFLLSSFLFSATRHCCCVCLCVLLLAAAFEPRSYVLRGRPQSPLWLPCLPCRYI